MCAHCENPSLNYNCGANNILYYIVIVKDLEVTYNISYANHESIELVRDRLFFQQDFFFLVWSGGHMLKSARTLHV